MAAMEERFTVSIAGGDSWQITAETPREAAREVRRMACQFLNEYKRLGKGDRSYYYFIYAGGSDNDEFMIYTVQAFIGSTGAIIKSIERAQDYKAYKAWRKENLGY